MADFITQIQNIATLTPITTRNTQRISDIATLIHYGTTDSVNFSKEGLNLSAIANIDNQFDALLGTPALNSEENSTLQTLSSYANTLFNSGSLQPRSIDFEGIMKHIETIYAGENLSKSDKQTLTNLTAQLQSYVQNLSISQLFSTTQPSTNPLFNERLTAEEKGDLGKIAQQLNRVLFSSSDSSATSFLDSLNSLYGLNPTTKEEESDIFSLFTKRNALLSSVLLNRNLLSNYGDIL